MGLGCGARGAGSEIRGDRVALPYKRVRPSRCMVRHTPHVGELKGLKGGKRGKCWGTATGMAAALSLSSLRHWRQGLTLCQAQPWTQGP